MLKIALQTGECVTAVLTDLPLELFELLVEVGLLSAGVGMPGLGFSVGLPVGLHVRTEHGLLSVQAPQLEGRVTGSADAHDLDRVGVCRGLLVVVMEFGKLLESLGLLRLGDHGGVGPFQVLEVGDRLVCGRIGRRLFQDHRFVEPVDRLDLLAGLDTGE